jgi:hypothetical protein
VSTEKTGETSVLYIKMPFYLEHFSTLDLVDRGSLKKEQKVELG